MIKTTRWKPDTCDCVIEYEWDTEVAQEQRVHTLKTIKSCQPHYHLPSDQAYQQVIKENQLKNKIHSTILHNMPEVVDTQTDSQGNALLKLKAGIEYQWSFDANRNIQVSLKGGTASQKSALSALLNSNFQAGLVTAV